MSIVKHASHKKGKKTGVFLSYAKYHRLMEDLHDLKKVAERHAEKDITLEELKKKIKKKNLV